MYNVYFMIYTVYSVSYVLHARAKPSGHKHGKSLLYTVLCTVYSVLYAPPIQIVRLRILLFIRYYQKSTYFMSLIWL